MGLRIVGVLTALSLLSCSGPDTATSQPRAGSPNPVERPRESPCREGVRDVIALWSDLAGSVLPVGEDCDAVAAVLMAWLETRGDALYDAQSRVTRFVLAEQCKDIADLTRGLDTPGDAVQNVGLACSENPRAHEAFQQLAVYTGGFAIPQ